MGTFRRTGPAVALTLALTAPTLVLAACSEPVADHPATPPPSPPPSSSIVSCAHDLGATAPRDTARLVLDSVVLPTRMLEVHESGEPGRLFAKNGLIVRADVAVDIAVAPEAAAEVSIGWGGPGPQGAAVQVPACPSSSGWLAFAGGYTVRAPGCVPLIIRVAGREERANVAVGADCR